MGDPDILPDDLRQRKGVTLILADHDSQFPCLSIEQFWKGLNPYGTYVHTYEKCAQCQPLSLEKTTNHLIKVIYHVHSTYFKVVPGEKAVAPLKTDTVLFTAPADEHSTLGATAVGSITKRLIDSR